MLQEKLSVLKGGWSIPSHTKWTPNETIWLFVLVFLFVDGGTGNWCTCPLWLINGWFSNLGFHVSCQKYACKWNGYMCKGPWRWLMWNMKCKSKAKNIELKALLLHSIKPLFLCVTRGSKCFGYYIHHVTDHLLLSLCTPPQSVAVLWESSTDLPTTIHFSCHLFLVP